MKQRVHKVFLEEGSYITYNLIPAQVQDDGRYKASICAGCVFDIGVGDCGFPQDTNKGGPRCYAHLYADGQDRIYTERV